MRPMSGTCTLQPSQFPWLPVLTNIAPEFLVIQRNLSNNNIFNQHLSPSVSVLSGLTRHHLIQSIVQKPNSLKHLVRTTVAESHN